MIKGVVVDRYGSLADWETLSLGAPPGIEPAGNGVLAFGQPASVLQHGARAAYGASGEITATDSRYGRRRLGGSRRRAGAETTGGSEGGRYGTVDRFSGPVEGQAGSMVLAGGRVARIRGGRTRSILVEGDGDLSKSEMISQVASRASLSKGEAAAAVDGVFEAIQDALASGESVSLTGFGTFSVKSRSARTGVTRGRARASRSPPQGRRHSRRARPGAMRCASVQRTR